MVENNDIVMEHLPTRAKTEVRKYASLLDWKGFNLCKIFLDNNWTKVEIIQMSQKNLCLLRKY
jgi:hypothetical protein